MLEDLVKQTLVEIGEDPEREGLIKTPERVVQLRITTTGIYWSVFIQILHT